MSNIHGLHAPAAVRGVPVPLQVPLPQKMFPSFTEMVCPGWKLTSITLVLSVLEVMLMVITLIVGAVLFDGAVVVSNTLVGPSGETLLFMGGKYVPNIRNGEYWRLVTPIFLHAGLLHLFSNLFFQLRLGFLYEKYWGSFRFFGIYLFGGIMGVLWSCGINPLIISVGASGALFGLLGGELAWILINWFVMVPVARNQALTVLVITILTNLILGFISPLVDYAAHLGGFFGGLFFGGSILPKHFEAEEYFCFGRVTPFRIISPIICIIMTLSILIAIFNS